MAGCAGEKEASSCLIRFRCRRSALLAASIFLAWVERIAISFRKWEGGYSGGRVEGVGRTAPTGWFVGEGDEGRTERVLTMLQV